MKVKRFMLCDSLESNAFIAWCEKTRSALLVDAGEFQQEMLEFCTDQHLRLKTIFITHDHHDHTEGLREACTAFGATVYAAKNGFGDVAASRIGDGGQITIGAETGTVRPTPGHTPDGLSLIFTGHVFTGDALFAGSVGGTSDPSLAQQQIDHIRKNIFTLPGDCLIFPGHGPCSTVEIERSYNPFFV
jgi:hydroxyacylglutathione hydrolase